MTIAESFSEFLINVTYDELPEQAVDHAAMIIASTLASAACGRHINSSQIVSDIEIQRGGTPEASVWFEKNVRLPVIGTARANALMSDAAASDDSDLRNIVHAGTPLTAAALAAAEAIGTSGKDILAAIVVGYEAAGRIGEAIMPNFDYRGHHGYLLPSTCDRQLRTLPLLSRNSREYLCCDKHPLHELRYRALHVHLHPSK